MAAMRARAVTNEPRMKSYA